jgi:hypothetical protein
MSFNNTEDQLSQFMSDVFFETGTFLGDSAKRAKLMGFKKVITVELQEYLHEKAKENGLADIDYYLGDSPQVMREVLPGLDGKITFWLDAHIDGGNYIPGVTPEIRECPLYEELNCIKSLKRNDHTILIDDMRIIGVVGWGLGTVRDELIRMLKDINPDYKIYYIDGHEPNDILVAEL